MRLLSPTPAVAVLAVLASAGCSERTADQAGSLGADGKEDSFADNCKPSRLLLVLDKSSSMQTGEIDGKTKWSIATEAIDSVLAEFDDSIEFGLTLFPAPSKCGPGEVAVSPAFDRRAAISSALSTAPPDKGNWTPMAQTLEAMVDDPALAGGGAQKYVVLVTDGWQWCSPYDPDTRFTPVDAVARLKEAGVTAFVVGFGAEVDALTLNMMALTAGTARPGCDASGASPGAAAPCYYQADSPLELHEALREISVSIAAEDCDGQDNDCDGRVDEDLARSCSTNCGSGTETCQSGIWSGCDAPPELPDVCDSVDNDCDGVIDPDCECQPGQTQPCGNNPEIGPCRNGTQTCRSDGRWGECEGDVAPETEDCDLADNDCDGKVDEDLRLVCFSECDFGKQLCVSGNWTDCDATQPQDEICDGKDNDCNGDTDEGCECIPGETDECGETNEGECVKGTMKCDADGKWGACEGEVKATDEICDKRDNDCDGHIDNIGEPSEDDDVKTVCPRGDDDREPPQQTGDPAPPPPPDDEPDNKDEQEPVTGGGCSSTGGHGAAAGALWVFALCAVSRRRRRHR